MIYNIAAQQIKINLVVTDYLYDSCCWLSGGWGCCGRSWKSDCDSNVTLRNPYFTTSLTDIHSTV